jgi:hypothetical protein
MLPPFVRRYLLMALDGAPTIVDALVTGIPAGDALWDARPDPDRFTLREVLAHLATWDAIFLERIERTRADDNAVLDPVDVDDHGRQFRYSLLDPNDSRANYRRNRADLLAVIAGLRPEDWGRSARYRSGERAADGPITIEAWVTQIVAHDAYHLRQIAEWTSS